VPEEPSFRHDLAAARAFLRATLGESLPVAMIGYSFGCSLLPHAGIDDATPLVLIAPTIDTHDHGAYAALPNPLLVFASEGDFALDAGRLRQWFDGLSGPRQLLVQRMDSHFFRGHEELLLEATRAFLVEQWS
jgi:alpha/beta superfamily hydrolase